MKKLLPLDIILFLFMVLFIYAATTKLLEYDLFKGQISKSPLITYHSNWISWLIPTLELVISLALFIPRLQLVGLYASFSLMVMFTMYISFLLMFSPYVPCSCGGILSGMGWTEHLIFNIAFTLLAVLGIYLFNRKKTKEGILIPVA